MDGLNYAVAFDDISDDDFLGVEGLFSRVNLTSEINGEKLKAEFSKLISSKGHAAGAKEILAFSARYDDSDDSGRVALLVIAIILMFCVYTWFISLGIFIGLAIDSDMRYYKAKQNRERDRDEEYRLDQRKRELDLIEQELRIAEKKKQGNFTKGALLTMRSYFDNITSKVNNDSVSTSNESFDEDPSEDFYV